MPATRSQTKTAEGSTLAKKRVASDAPAQPSAKKAKKAPNAADQAGVITINRAPVLHLWSACVASFLYEELPWATCLSVGSAISTLCAISKGQAIGAISKSDPADADKTRQERRDNMESKQLDELEVMGFDLAIENGNAVVSGRPKKVNEATLKQKYDDQAYAEVKSMFETALRTWHDDVEELNSRAFHMYEVFRPTVPPGQKGWGRKGQMSLEDVKTTISKS